jgi:hypothetical protein
MNPSIHASILRAASSLHKPPPAGYYYYVLLELFMIPIPESINLQLAGNSRA